MELEEMVVFSLLGLPVTSYALCLALGLGAGLLLYFWWARRQGIGENPRWRGALLALPLGVIGARLFYCLARIYLYEEIGLDAVFRLWEGGYALWGAVGGAALGGFLAAKISRCSAASLLDAMAFPGAVMIALARLAEYFSGEGRGLPVENETFQRFPLAVYYEAFDAWYIPVFLLEALAALAIAWAVAKRKPARPGDGARLFLLLYSACQITLESLRRDLCLKWLFVRVSQVTALIVILGLMAAATLRFCASKKSRLVSPRKAALRWLAVALSAGLVVLMEFSVDGKLLQSIPLSVNYLVIALCSAVIGWAAYGLVFPERREAPKTAF